MSLNLTDDEDEEEEEEEEDVMLRHVESIDHNELIDIENGCSRTKP